MHGVLINEQAMNVKFDTREKFHVITLLEPSLSAALTEELRACLLPFLQKDVKNLIICLQDVTDIEEVTAHTLANLQQEFYEQHASFVCCGLQKQVEAKLDEWELLEFMNITPTESEAWDIVQMEEIERELLGE